MIREWKLVAAPSESNAERQQLLLQCDMKDVFMIVKELGRICSRPEKSKGDFNFTIYLSKVSDDVDTKLQDIAKAQGLDQLEKTPAPGEQQAPAMEINPFLTQPGFPIMPNVKPIQVIDSDAVINGMSSQLFPSAMDNFGSVNSLPGVSPEAAAAAGMLPSGGMESVFVDTSDDDIPAYSQNIASIPEAKPIAPARDYAALTESSRRQADSANNLSAGAQGNIAPKAAPSAAASAAQANAPVLPPPPSAAVTARSIAHGQAAAAQKAQSNRLAQTAATKPAQTQTVPPAVNQAAKAASAPAMPKAPEINSKEKKLVNPFVAAKPQSGFIPAAHIKRDKDIVKKEEKVEEQVVKVEAPKPQAINLNTRWNIEMPLNPTQNINTMISGSHNRFAHAAAMAVVETPGNIYNPLVIYGQGSSGKTHFVNIITEGIAKSIGYEDIFVTTGMRLSKGVDIAVKSGKIKELDEMMSKYKALIIDDVHLMMLTEANKPYISKWLNGCVNENKQIVITTAIPVHALATIEEALNFQFSQGWSVDLKAPSSQNYSNILRQHLSSMNVNINEGETTEFFINSRMPLKEVNLVLQDMFKLEKFITSETQQFSHGELLEMLLGTKETAAEAPNEEELERASRWKPSINDLWLKWGIMYPKGEERNAYFTMYSLFQQAQQLGLQIEWQQVFLKDYDPSNITVAAFSIGDFVVSQSVNGVLVLGPQPNTEAFDKEEEFKHFVLNILGNMSLKTGWVPYEKIKSPAACTRAIMDLM